VGAEVDPDETVVVGWVVQGAFSGRGGAVLFDEEGANALREGLDAFGYEDVGGHVADVCCGFGQVWVIGEVGGCVFWDEEVAFWDGHFGLEATEVF